MKEEDLDLVLDTSGPAPIWAAPTEGIFKHKPLDTTKREIRLLRLQQTEHGVAGIIEHFELGLSPPYRALSYMWGMADEDSEITLNHATFKVRKHLFDFLVQYESRCSDGDYLWVDQICINQHSTSERNHTVRHMEDIFADAQIVLIWLHLEHDFHTWSECHRCSCRSRHIGCACDLDVRIGKHHYWRRLWIVQEVLLARRARVILQQEQRLAAFPIDAVDHIESAALGSLLESAMSFQDGRRSHIRMEQAFLSWARNECSDPRDKVYALQSLVYTIERLHPDYDKTVAEVYADAIVRILRIGLYDKDRSDLIHAICALDVAMGFPMGGINSLARLQVIIAEASRDTQRPNEEHMTQRLLLEVIKPLKTGSWA